MREPIIFTIGHSTHPVGEFIALLDAYGIKAVADVRAVPRSRHNPQFGETELRGALQSAHIHHWHLAKLGGLRHVKPESTNLGWSNSAFRGYADYMQWPEFEDGFQQLMRAAGGQKR